MNELTTDIHFPGPTLEFNRWRLMWLIMLIIKAIWLVQLSLDPGQSGDHHKKLQMQPKLLLIEPWMDKDPPLSASKWSTWDGSQPRSVSPFVLPMCQTRLYHYDLYVLFICCIHTWIFSNPRSKIMIKKIEGQRLRNAPACVGHEVNIGRAACFEKSNK